MPESFQKYLSEDKWLIERDGFYPQEQGLQEAIFSLGNGYLGSRGVMEEIPEGSYPGTYIAGIYDQSEAQTVEIVNCPNPVYFQIYVEGKKLSPDKTKILAHHRTLDLQKGLLLRRTIFQDSRHRRYEYQSLRFFSKNDPHLGVMKVSFVSLDEDVDISVKTGIDTSISNQMQAVGGPVKHYKVVDENSNGNICSALIKTNDRGILLAYASDLSVNGDKKYIFEEEPDRGSIQRLSLTARQGRAYVFERFFAIYASRDFPARVKAEYLVKKARSAVKNYRKVGFDNILSRHIKSWREMWLPANVEIPGDPEAERALRFNIYHLLIVGNEDDCQVSIAPKSLTGEWYKGHAFWDTEIFIIPFFIHTNPRVAKNLLLYRYYRLNRARKIAREQKYRGALFPWESADTGEEVAPKKWRNFDGSIIKVHTMEREHHIVGDIAHAAFSYYRASGDKNFLLNYGAEILFESARFWASRVKQVKGGKYEIRNVIGPNEFQEKVDNNSYTNYLARWNLLYACELYREFLSRYPERMKKLLKRIRLTQAEVKKWKEIGEKITLLIREDGLIEEFQGYFQKRDPSPLRRDRNGMPTYPEEVPLTEVKDTQLVKQADVMLIFHLFPGEFSPAQRIINFDYYENRTTHKSSLSPSIYAIVACEIGNVGNAYQYFSYTVNSDLENHYGNTHLGIHTATVGGVWQSVIHGFAGIRVEKDVLSVKPRLPGHWEGLKFKFFWKGQLIEFDISKDEVKLYFRSKKKTPLDVRIFDTLHRLEPNKLFCYYI